MNMSDMQKIKLIHMLLNKTKSLNIENKGDVFLLFNLYAKSNDVDIKEDRLWIVLRDKKYKIKFVKNFFYNQLYYNGFNISSNYVDDVEIVIFETDKLKIKTYSLDYRNFERSKLPDYMKTRYDLSKEEAEKIFYEVWLKLMEMIKPKWSLRKLHYNILYFIAYRNIKKKLVKRCLTCKKE